MASVELPDIATPRAVTKAAALVREREADVAAAREAVEHAKRDIEAARAVDRALLADSLDAGADDPGTPNEDEARARLVDAERRLAGEELRLQRAHEGLDVTIAESIEAWEVALVKATEQAEAETLDLCDKLQAAERVRARCRAALGWVELRRAGNVVKSVGAPVVARSGVHVNVMANPNEYHSLPDLIGHIRAGIEASTLRAERERVAEHEAAEREAQTAQPYLHVANG